MITPDDPRYAAVRAKLDRLDGLRPTATTLAAVEAQRPRRRRVVDRGTTPAQREAFVRRALAPPAPARPRVTLADVHRAADRQEAEPPWLPRVSRLVASGHPPSTRFSGGVRDNSVACAHCGVRHRLDYQCEAMRNRTPAGSYSAVVANGGRL